MGELSSDLLRFIKDTFRKCDDVFLYHHDLWCVFNDSRLNIWQERLPEALNVGQRIESIIDYLRSKGNTQGESALVLFIQILSERYLASDERHDLLLNIIYKLQTASPPQQEEQYSDILSDVNPSEGQMLAIAELEPISRCARSIALIKVRRYRSGEIEYRETGTGWLIAPGLVLTCWHVVAALAKPDEPPPITTDLQLQLTDMLLFFNQIESSKGSIQYKVNTLEYPLNKTDQLDFAILRLEDRGDHPYSQFSYLPIELDTPFTLQTQFSIIQHPWGEHQQVAISGHFVSHSGTTGRILYTTETQPGTSGAPVLNRHNWLAVALHNGKVGETRLREGTRIKYILSKLQDKKPDLYHEIVQAQYNLNNPLPSMSLTSPLSSYTPTPLTTFQASFSPENSAKQEEVSLEETASITDSNGNLASEILIQDVTNQPDQPVSRQIKQTSQKTVLKEYRQKIAKYRPEIRHIRKKLRTKTTLYSDECFQMLAGIQPLYKPINEMERFTTQKLSKSYPGRLELTASLHHLQALLNELSERMATFCAHCQDNAQEERKEIIQKVDELNEALSLERPGKHFSLWLHR